MRSFYWGILLISIALTLGGNSLKTNLLIAQEIRIKEVKSNMQAMFVTDFFPKEYVTDGSISYQVEIQYAIDAASRENCILTFPPMIYQIDESGLEIHSNLTLVMHGAIFQLEKGCNKDGQAFIGHSVTDVNFLGGEIKGNQDIWPAGVNIRGIYLTGESKKIRIHDLYIHNLSSNGIGIFGTPEKPARDVWVTDVIVENCCNYYGDYLSKNAGPEKGSDGRDQGLIAFYHVHDFTIRGCRLEKSRSDGTHFYKCHQGQFVHNKVYAAQMGGYFLETCEDVSASNNIVRDNGSRGVTIERGSQNCLLQGNLVASSGREGLWAPDCIGLIVTGNIFDRNGRKPNGTKPHQVWNANITVNEASHDPTNSPTKDYIISENILYTTDSQVASIRIDASTVKDIIVKNNLLRGENQEILVEGDNEGNVSIQSNE